MVMCQIGAGRRSGLGSFNGNDYVPASASTFVQPARRGPETRDLGASKPALFAGTGENVGHNRLTRLAQFECDDER